VLHRACSYDAAHPRVLRHTRISGEATEQAPPAPAGQVYVAT
jgi:hypothetical protein